MEGLLQSLHHQDGLRRGLSAEQIGGQHGREQPLGVRLAGVGAHGRRVQRLDDPPVLHDRDPIAHRRGKREVVGDEEHGELPGAPEVGEHRHDLLLGRHVERGGDLVREQDRRIHGERRRDHHPLQQAAGEVAGALPHPPLGVGDADLGEQLDRATLGGIRRLARHGDERLGHEVADRPQRVEVRARRLEHHPEPPRADVAQALRGQVGDVLSVDPDRALDREPFGQQAGHGADRHRLARSRLADEAEHLARAPPAACSRARACAAAPGSCGPRPLEP